LLSTSARSGGGATPQYARATQSAMSASGLLSTWTPIQPPLPTYGGTKNRPGSDSTRSACESCRAKSHSAMRPSPWWSFANIAKIRPLPTRNVGAPQAVFSIASGSARQMRRTRAR
jgi:hypothetical protein